MISIEREQSGIKRTNDLIENLTLFMLSHAQNNLNKIAIVTNLRSINK
jgi:hypothetical protein